MCMAAAELCNQSADAEYSLVLNVYTKQANIKWFYTTKLECDFQETSNTFHRNRRSGFVPFWMKLPTKPNHM